MIYLHLNWTELVFWKELVSKAAEAEIYSKYPVLKGYYNDYIVYYTSKYRDQEI